MNIVIKQENAEKINRVIKEAEGSARTRCCDYSDLMKGIENIESVLKISKTALNGTTATISPHATKFPNAYKYIPMGTRFYVKFTSGTWKLSGVCRYNVNDSHKYRLELSGTAEEAILKNHGCF